MLSKMQNPMTTTVISSSNYYGGGQADDDISMRFIFMSTLEEAMLALIVMEYEASVPTRTSFASVHLNRGFVTRWVGQRVNMSAASDTGAAPDAVDYGLCILIAKVSELMLVMLAESRQDWRGASQLMLMMLSSSV